MESYSNILVGGVPNQEWRKDLNNKDRVELKQKFIIHNLFCEGRTIVNYIV